MFADPLRANAIVCSTFWGERKCLLNFQIHISSKRSQVCEREGTNMLNMRAELDQRAQMRVHIEANICYSTLYLKSQEWKEFCRQRLLGDARICIRYIPVYEKIFLNLEDIGRQRSRGHWITFLFISIADRKPVSTRRGWWLLRT